MPKHTMTDYATEMSLPVHRPGMEGVVNRSSADARDASGNRTGGRRQVGEADPATRKRLLDEALGESSPAPKPSAPSPKPADGGPLSSGDSTQPATGIGGAARSKTILDSVDSMS